MGRHQRKVGDFGLPDDVFRRAIPEQDVVNILFFDILGLDAAAAGRIGLWIHVD